MLDGSSECPQVRDIESILVIRGCLINLSVQNVLGCKAFVEDVTVNPSLLKAVHGSRKYYTKKLEMKLNYCQLLTRRAVREL